MKVASEAIGAVASRRASSLTAIVQGEIERMIVSGDLAAGQRLNEQHLAVQLRVSRGPIREALRALERAGLVTGVANLGMFVRQVGIDEAVELYEMRAVVFGFACLRLAGRATAEQKDVLRGCVAEMDEAIAVENAPDYYRLNLRFHDLIMEYSAHYRAAQMYESLVKEGHLFRQRSLIPIPAMRESNAEHTQILDAIIAGAQCRRGPSLQRQESLAIDAGPLTLDEGRARQAFETALREQKPAFEQFFLAKLYGLTFRYTDEACTVELDVHDFMFNPQGSLHGGVIAFAMDVSMGHFIKHKTGRPGITLEIKTQFLRPATAGRIRCEGRFLRQGRAISQMESRMYGADGKLAAVSTATWQMMQPAEG
jgi:uncharacterized protein (TIGR00369 family)